MMLAISLMAGTAYFAGMAKASGRPTASIVGLVLTLFLALVVVTIGGGGSQSPV